jgi:hypothetical protein
MLDYAARGVRNSVQHNALSMSLLEAIPGPGLILVSPRWTLADLFHVLRDQAFLYGDFLVGAPP